MFKRIALLGLIVSSTLVPIASPKAVTEKVVAWDIHKVLCTKPAKRGYQCTPQESTFELVRELHARGVKQVILSNISRESFCILIRCYPNYFKYFDREGSLADAQVLLTRKPHGKYFKIFLKNNPGIRPDNIIFFDDKPKNIKGAREKCIDGQIFCSAAQSRTILNRKGLL